MEGLRKEQLAALGITGAVMAGIAVWSVMSEDRPQLDPNVCMGEISDPNEPCFPVLGHPNDR